MPQPKGEILVPLDESDFLAHCERQEQKIAALQELSTNLASENKEAAQQIATLKAENETQKRLVDSHRAKHIFLDEELLKAPKQIAVLTEQANIHKKNMAEMAKLNSDRDEQIAALTEKLEFYRKNRTVQRLDALTAENKRLGDALEEISQFCDCEGPGCIYCEGDFHPPSAEAKIAQAALNQTGCTCGDDSHHGNDRHHAPTG